MKVLIGCEESGTVRRAFRSRGHLAYSCDLKPSRDNSEYHIQNDIVKYLSIFDDQQWDLIILHPDCTKMATSGNRFHANTSDRMEQVQWTLNLWDLAKKKGRSVALENPASVIWSYLRSRGATVQFIQPWMYGHPEKKKTGLALHNLPKLEETNNVYKRMMELPKSQANRVHFMGSSNPNRKRDRSETYFGIAEAMSVQWSCPPHLLFDQIQSTVRP